VKLAAFQLIYLVLKYRTDSMKWVKPLKTVEKVCMRVSKNYIIEKLVSLSLKNCSAGNTPFYSSNYYYFSYASQGRNSYDFLLFKDNFFFTLPYFFLSY
jgi:hypothetical protein